MNQFFICDNYYTSNMPVKYTHKPIPAKHFEIRSRVFNAIFLRRLSNLYTIPYILHTMKKNENKTTLNNT